MELRIGHSDDAEVVARLHADSWRVAYRGMYSDEYLDGDVFADRLRVWQQRMAMPAENQYLLLACEGDELLGFAFSLGNADARWGTLLDNLHVRRDQQGRGLGRRLLAASAVWSHQHYPEALFHLWVLDGNAKARRFYEQLGGRAHESRVSEPPGGGSIVGWRYIWDSLEPLHQLTETSPKRDL